MANVHERASRASQNIHRPTNWEAYDKRRAALWPSKDEVAEKIKTDREESRARAGKRISKLKKARKARSERSKETVKQYHAGTLKSQMLGVLPRLK